MNKSIEILQLDQIHHFFKEFITFKRNPYGYLIAAFSAIVVIPVFFMLADEASKMGKDVNIIYFVIAVISLIPIFTIKRAFSLLSKNAWVLKINNDFIAVNLRNNEYNSFFNTSKNAKVALISKNAIISIIPVNYRSISADQKVQLSMIDSLELKFSQDDYELLKGEINKEAKYISSLGGDLKFLNANICYKSLKADKNTIRIPFKPFVGKRKVLFNLLKKFEYPLLPMEARKLKLENWVNITWEWHKQHSK